MRLFRDQGYGATTVEQIAEAAEVSPATFYRYFPTKEDVVLQDDLDALALGELEALPPGLSPLAAVRQATARSVARFTAEDRERVRVTTAPTMAVPEIRARALDEFARTLDVFATALAKRTGREADDPAVRTLAGAIFGVILATTLPTLEGGGLGSSSRTSSPRSTRAWRCWRLAFRCDRPSPFRGGRRVSGPRGSGWPRACP